MIISKKTLRMNKNIRTQKQSKQYFANLVDDHLNTKKVQNNVYNKLFKSDKPKRRRNRFRNRFRNRRINKSEPIVSSNVIVRNVYNKMFNEPLPSDTIETDPTTRTILTNTPPQQLQIKRNKVDKLLLNFNNESPLNLDIELNTTRYTDKSFNTVIDDSFTEFIVKTDDLDLKEDVEDLSDEVERLENENKLLKAQSDASSKQLNIELDRNKTQIKNFNNTITKLIAKPDGMVEKPNVLEPFGPIKDQDFFDKLYQEYKNDERNRTSTVQPWGNGNVINWGEFKWNVQKYVLIDKEKSTAEESQSNYERFSYYIRGLLKGYDLAPTNALVRILGRTLGDFARTSISKGNDVRYWKVLTAEYGDAIEELKKLKR